ncbi:hypothetical protein ACH5RR_024975 [Cinchona calisaya]|uniref:Uncharacterized protein n=1 Tax=Cinchona calisaya TaxID=153742 RepID=A0ABD2YZD9_9GENT
MDAEKKRKRGDHGGDGERRRKRNEVAQPSEEEVEEFFTILRRMQVAVKYFEKTGSNINELNGDVGRETTQFAEDGGVDGVKIGGKRDVVVENGGLDLNVVPEPES